MKKNNWLALLLAMVMAASALPLSAFAEEGREMDLVQNFEVLDPVFPQEEEVDQVPAQEEANSASSQEEEADEAPAPGGAEEGTPVQGEEPEETPEQEGETGSLAGTGSQEDPFRIASLEDLKLFRDQVNGGNTGKGEYYALTGNIDLKGEPWIPIAAGGGTFAGVFDGNGHIISNLVIEDPSLDGAGLFGTLASPGTIRNLTVENVSITAQSQAGGLVGHAFTGILENCTVRGRVQITAHYKVGGLTGGGYAAIQNCHLSASSGSRVTGLYKEPDLEGDNVGGLIGYRGEGACPITGSTVSGLAVTGTRKVGGAGRLCLYQ